MTPPDWDDARYLALHPDVALEVHAGRLPSGHAHYELHGRAEGRQPAWVAAPGEPLTRGCMDPWSYLEVTPDFGLRPCCKYSKPIARLESGPVSSLRDSAPFRELRSQLLDGNLSPICKSCHIRPWVPLKELRERVALASAGGDPARALPLKQVRLELTTRCNLRCVYCPVSQPHYKGRDLRASDAQRVLELVADCDPDAEILVNGHGETTYHPDWLAFCEPLLAAGKRLSIITNLAKPLERHEAACLARFAVIQLSLDTVDPQLLAQIRRKVQLRTIVENILLIRSLAAGKAPEFSISCGVYDRNVAGIPELARFAIEQSFRALTFWQLVKYKDVPDAVNVQPIPSLAAPRIREAIRSMDEALSLLRRAGLHVEIAGEFLDAWRGLVRTQALLERTAVE